MPTYFCDKCHHPTEHLNIQAAARYVGVTRATIYNWIKRSLVHLITHPSGRSFVCVNSLLMSGTSFMPESQLTSSSSRSRSAAA